MIDIPFPQFFSPQGVVIIGVSNDPTKLGYALARNIIQSGYKGEISFVNPKGEPVLGRYVYKSIDQVPDPVDLAVLLVPPKVVPDTLHQIGRRGIKAAIIATGGFKEVGGEGAELESECLKISQEYGIRLIGPNCVGLINTHLPLDTTFLPPPPPTPGLVAFVSHSGAICAAVVDWVRGQGFGLSHLVSLGNQVDICESDVLAPIAMDDHTRVITLYLESIKNGANFIQEAREVTRKKPIIALKVGRFESGRRAASSHTGALAGEDSTFDVVFKKAGVIRANTTEEMFKWARTLAWCPLAKGKNVAVLTNAGGPGVTAADALEFNHLNLAHLSSETIKGLAQILPASASLNNPVDMLASAGPLQYADCLGLLLNDPHVDSVMVISPPPPASTAGTIVKAIIPIIQSGEKPVVVVLMGERMIQEGVEYSRAAQIPDFRFPEEAASSLSALSKWSEIYDRVDEEPVVLNDVDPGQVKSVLTYPSKLPMLDPEILSEIMDAYKIPTLKLALARSLEETMTIADQLGYPLVMKIASPDISHKSDIGGVLLNLNNVKDIKEGYQQILSRVKSAGINAKIEGVHLQKMLPSGQEVIIGVTRDPQFGPLVMFGSGGVEVEGLKDIAFALAPLTNADANSLLENTWAGRKLKGFRNIPPSDREAVLDVLIRLGRLSVDFPEISEIEINPLRVLPVGQGAWGIDIRARVQGI